MAADGIWDCLLHHRNASTKPTWRLTAHPGGPGLVNRSQEKADGGGAAGGRATLWLSNITHMQHGRGRLKKCIYRPLEGRGPGQEALSKGRA